MVALGRILGSFHVRSRMKYLLRWGEIGLKSGPVRREMKRRLKRNINRLFSREEGSCSFVEQGGRLFLETDFPAALDLLRRVFGLVSFSPVEETSADLAEIVEVAMMVVASKGGGSFAVRARRVGNHPYTSMDLARELGAAIQRVRPDLRVDLDRPDWEVHVEVREDKAYVYTDIVEGPGGLPLGSQGKVVGLVESGRGVIASWLMMKRGCAVVPTYTEDDRWAAALRHWDPDVQPFHIASWDEMEDLVRERGALGCVYPWDVDEVRREDLRPAFYPLLGIPEEELEELRERVLKVVGLG